MPPSKKNRSPAGQQVPGAPTSGGDADPESVAYYRSFSFRADPGAGYLFDSDGRGHVFFAPEAGPAARANFAKCLDGTYDVIDDGVLRSSYREPAITRGPQPLT
jgi:hypothetical protein